MVNDPKTGRDTQPALGVSRRQLVVRAFAFSSLAIGGRGLEIDPIVGQPPTGPTGTPGSSEMREIARAFLFRNSHLISGIPSTGFPFLREEVHPAARVAIKSLIEHLGLVDQFRELRNLDTASIEGDSGLIGGPVNNWHSRMILGNGRYSPLFSLIKAGDNVQPPVRFDLSALETLVRERRPERVWPLIVENRRIDDPGDLLLITSIPDPYQEDARILILASNLSPGMSVPELLLGDRQYSRGLERLMKETRNLEGWQVLIPVAKFVGESAVELGDPRIYNIDVDFSALRKLLVGKPSFSNPTDERYMGFMGLMAAYIDIHPQERKIDADSPPSESVSTRSAASQRTGERTLRAAPNVEQSVSEPHSGRKTPNPVSAAGKKKAAADIGEFVDRYIEKYGRQLTVDEENELFDSTGRM